MCKPEKHEIDNPPTSEKSANKPFGEIRLEKSVQGLHRFALVIVAYHCQPTQTALPIRRSSLNPHFEQVRRCIVARYVRCSMQTIGPALYSTSWSGPVSNQCTQKSCFTLSTFPPLESEPWNIHSTAATLG
jgi:hypothetical protein